MPKRDHSVDLYVKTCSGLSQPGSLDEHSGSAWAPIHDIRMSGVTGHSHRSNAQHWVPRNPFTRNAKRATCNLAVNGYLGITCGAKDAKGFITVAE
jgi:hypothetical protein